MLRALTAGALRRAPAVAVAATATAGATAARYSSTASSSSSSSTASSSPPQSATAQQRAVVGALAGLGKMELRYGNARKAAFFFRAANHYEALRVASPADMLADANGIGSSIRGIVADIVKQGRSERLETALANAVIYAVLHHIPDFPSEIAARVSRAVKLEPALHVDYTRFACDADHKAVLDKIIDNFDEIKQIITRDEELAIEDSVRAHIQKVDSDLMADLAGASRLGVPRTYATSTIFVTSVSHSSKDPAGASSAKTTKSFAKLVASLKSDGVIEHVLGEGATYCMAFVRTPLPEGAAPDTERLLRRVAIQLLPIEQYWPTVMHNTGNKHFWNWITYRAGESGFTLKKEGLVKNGDESSDPLVILNEQEIFERIGLVYVAPERRGFRSPAQIRRYREWQSQGQQQEADK